MKELTVALEKALKKLRELSSEIRIMLANASAMNFDVEDVVERIRNDAYEIADACDATDDGFADMDDDIYFDQEND